MKSVNADDAMGLWRKMIASPNVLQFRSHLGLMPVRELQVYGEDVRLALVQEGHYWRLGGSIPQVLLTFNDGNELAVEFDGRRNGSKLYFDLSEIEAML